MVEAWNPLTLHFGDNVSERAYAAHSATARLEVDLYTYCTAFLLASIPLEGDDGYATLLKEGSGHVLPALLCYLCLRHRRAYVDWRDLLLGIFQLTGTAYACAKDSTLPAPNPELNPELMYILSRVSKSPIISTVFHTILLPLRFRHQVALSAFHLLGVIFWSAGLCGVCHGDDFQQLFQYFGSFNYNIVSTVSMNGIGVFLPKLECFSVVTFVEVLVGLMLPLYYSYNMEAASRAAYLSRNVGEAETTRIVNLKREYQGWSLWILVVSIIAVWMMC